MSKPHIHIHISASYLRPANTKDAAGKWYVKNLSGQVVKVCSTEAEANLYIKNHPTERLHTYNAEANSKDAAPSDEEVRAYVKLREENDKLFAEIEKKEDQGAAVPSNLRRKAEAGRNQENAVRAEVKQAARAKGWLDKK